MHKLRQDLLILPESPAHCAEMRCVKLLNYFFSRMVPLQKFSLLFIFFISR